MDETAEKVLYRTSDLGEAAYLKNRDFEMTYLGSEKGKYKMVFNLAGKNLSQIQNDYLSSEIHKHDSTVKVLRNMLSKD